MVEWLQKSVEIYYWKAFNKGEHSKSQLVLAISVLIRRLSARI